MVLGANHLSHAPCADDFGARLLRKPKGFFIDMSISTRLTAGEGWDRMRCFAWKVVLLLVFSAFAGLASLVSARALTYSFAPVDLPNCRPNCGEMIVASGEISGREAEEFAWFIRHSGRDRQLFKVVLLHSPGGNAYGGMSLGAVFRQAGVAVIIARPAEGGFLPGLCGSACVFALAGGTKRVVPPGSIVAVHSARQIQTEMHDRLSGTVQSTLVDRGSVTRAFGDYYARMGVGRGLAALGEQTPHSDARILSPQEIRKFKLATPKF
jgi:hypothetical protein